MNYVPSIDKFSWQGAWIILGGFGMVVVVPLSVLLLRRQPEDMGLLPDGDLELSNENEIFEEYSWTVTEAVKTFKKEEDNHKVLVLMTDGEDHLDGVTDATQKAKDIGLKIFTIGLGSAKGELIQLPDPQTGRLEFLKDENGNVVKSRLNETL